MEREEANDKYKWNLSDIYNSQEEWDKDFEEVKNNVDKFNEYKGKLNDKNVLKEYYDFSEKFNRKFMNLYIYAFLGHDISLKDTRYEDNLSKIYNLDAKLSQVTAYILPELSSMDDSYLKELIADDDFKNYKLSHESIMLNKKHILSEKEETALATMEGFSGGFSDIYDTLMDTDLVFDSFVVDNKEYKMSNEKYSNYLVNTNREIRKKAYDSLYKSYTMFAHTFAKIFYNNLKMNSSDLKLREYSTLLNATLEGEKIPVNVYNKLIEKVDENVETMKDYYRLLKEKSGIKDFKFYDTYVSISSMDKKFEYEEQKEIVKAALSVLGDEYVSLLEEAFSHNWVDVYPSDTKSSGGYQYGTYDTHPYVFLNNTDDYSSLSTLAHELGHAMHSYYSNKNQPFATSGYSIYVAEVASTVNEILLNRYMLEHSESKEDKIFFIDQYIKEAKATVFRQTMFSEFEQKVHSLAEKEVPLSLEAFNAEYKNLLEKHFSGVVDIDDKIVYEWIRISHFYRPFYVYKYATSFTTANYIATCILEDKNNMKEKYFELLKSGGKDWPDNLLKNIGVNLETDEPYDILMNDLKKSISSLKELLNVNDCKKSQSR